jgi:hypothetical protein
MSASKALLVTLPSGNAPRAFTPRRRRRPRIQRTSAPVASGNGVSLLSIGLVGVVSLLLSLLACSFIVTGLAVWVANGAAEWLAAVVPGALSVLLFAFAWRLVRLLGDSDR